MLRARRPSWSAFATQSLGILVLCSCATVASTGDEVIRKASLGRIQATPFVNHLQTKDCQSSLDSTYGFTRESRAMKNGVFVVETFDCKADLVVVGVSLSNYTTGPMRCYAETDKGTSEVTIVPKGAGFFEYAYSTEAFQTCESLDGSAD